MTVKPDDPLFGTWVNTEYEGGKNLCAARAVIFPEGKEWGYLQMSDSTPTYERKFTIVESWIDEEGNRWYKMEKVTDYYPWPSKEPMWMSFYLTRINAVGTIMEIVGRESGFPEELSPIGGAYVIYYKQ